MVRRYDDAIDVQMSDIRMQGGQVKDVHDGPGSHDKEAPVEGGLVVSQPETFVWRDRLYVVRAVQARWYERRAWWRETAAAALLGLRGDDASVCASPKTASLSVPASSATRVRSTGPSDHPRQAGTSTQVRDLSQRDVFEYVDGETEVWRVEAAAGRSFPVGVFDLARSVSVGSVAPGGWRLTRVTD